jgi:excisionase family DNA binding protein
MSLEETLETLIRKVMREELRAASMADRLMTVQQVAEYLGYDTHTIYQLKRQRKLRGIKLGENSVRFRHSEVERFIQERAS